MQQHLATVKRIYENISILLSTGQFPGSAAEAVLEAQSFVSKFIQEIEASNGQAGSETGSSVQPEENASRVGSDAVGSGRKQGRKPKAKRA
jgi:hypothetical protein